MIIICPSAIKDRYLKNNGIHNYKFYTLNEIKEKVFFKYDNLALYEVVKKYNVKPSIALEMLNNLYYACNINLKTKKLLEVKEHLVAKKLLINDENFLNFLKDEIIIEGYPLNKELNRIIDILSVHTKVTYKLLENKYELKEIYAFNNIDAEIEYVLENILELINKGIDINKIVLINYNQEYIGSINKLFSLFKIPFNIRKNKSILMFPLTKKFLKFIKTSDLKISELNDFLNSLKSENNDILNQIINVLNKYYGLNESVKNLYEIICFDLKNTFMNEEKYTNVVNIYSEVRTFDDDYYVFYISANEVSKYKDNDYLADSEKSLLNIDTSFELNQIDHLNNFNILTNIKNLSLSYKTHNGDNEYVIDHLFENLEIKNYEIKHNSLKYNEYLFSNYKIYDNSYTKIEFDDLKKYLDNKLNLSYSSMEQFFRCKYRFFLNNILKIEPYEETMAIKVGNMFHKILERTLKNNYENYLEIINEESNNFLNDSLKEKFYSEKLKNEAIKIIERLKDNSDKSDFKEYEFEKYFEIPMKSEMNIKLVGFADKILIFNDGINSYVIVVDYKTGSYAIDLAKVKDGFNMQLLIYLYLITNLNFVSNPKIAGAYIDHILDELKPSEYGKKYDEIVDDRLDGLTIKNQEILKHIDKYYDVKSFIKGIRVKNDGEFYSNARVYSENDFKILFKIVENNINEVINSIENCDFEINPKRYLGTKIDEIVGCEYCPFKEVCYMNAKNIKLISKGTLEEMLGDNDEMDN